MKLTAKEELNRIVILSCRLLEVDITIHAIDHGLVVVVRAHACCVLAGL